jgi:hypothetical protein
MISDYAEADSLRRKAERGALGKIGFGVVSNITLNMLLAVGTPSSFRPVLPACPVV